MDASVQSSAGKSARLFQKFTTAAKAIANFAGIDHTSLFGIVTQIWAPSAGIVTVFLITHFFTPQIQGLHYTFLSLMGMQMLVELGLGQVLLQFASHEWAKLKFENNQIVGDPDALARLASLARLGTRWYVIAALFFLAAMECVGYFSFKGTAIVSDWVLPWSCLCLAVSVDMALVPLWSLLSGCGQIKSVYFLQLVRAVVSSIGLWAGLSLGAGIWSAAISLWSGITAAVLLGAWRHNKYFLCVFTQHIENINIDWLSEVWPVQWRTAITWFTGYFYFYLFVPALFKFHGAVAAGQLGMTLNIVAPVSSISSMLIVTKAPAFGKLVAEKRWSELDKVTLRVGASAIGVFAIGAACLLTIVIYMRSIGVPLAFRLLPPETISLFLLASFGSQISLPMSIYLRSHKREPLMALSVVSGLLLAVGVTLLGPPLGAFGMGLAYAGVSILFTIPYVTIVFFRCRAAWHAP